MALIQCKECEKEISSEAESCPSCGAPLKPIKKKGGFLNFIKRMVLRIVVILAVLYAGFIYMTSSFEETVSEVKDTIQDTTLQIVVFSDELGRNDTSFIRKKDLSSYQENDNFIGITREEPMERVEAIEYYKTYIPDSSTYYCPLTNNEYIMEISDDGTDLTISSPIEEPIVESHYILFSFKGTNHGVIKSGRKSWE